jgi:hypothetical protein
MEGVTAWARGQVGRAAGRQHAGYLDQQERGGEIQVFGVAVVLVPVGGHVTHYHLSGRRNA